MSEKPADSFFNPATSPCSTSNLFEGITTTTSTTKNATEESSYLFGNAASTAGFVTPVDTGGSLFGKPASTTQLFGGSKTDSNTTTVQPLFGNDKSGSLSTSSSSLFGSNKSEPHSGTTVLSPLFGGTIGDPTPAIVPPLFGGTTARGDSSGFNTANKSASAFSLPQSSNNTVFGSTPFSSGSTSTGVFGASIASDTSVSNKFSASSKNVPSAIVSSASSVIFGGGTTSKGILPPATTSSDTRDKLSSVFGSSPSITETTRKTSDYSSMFGGSLASYSLESSKSSYHETTKDSVYPSPTSKSSFVKNQHSLFGNDSSVPFSISAALTNTPADYSSHFRTLPSNNSLVSRSGTNIQNQATVAVELTNLFRNAGAKPNFSKSRPSLFKSSVDITEGKAARLDKKAEVEHLQVTRPIPSYDDILESVSPSKQTKGTQVSQDKPEPHVIIAANIPNDFLDKSILKTHFSKFGTIVRVSIHAKANQAQITYTDHVGAALAKKQGKKLHPNIQPLMIFFATAVRQKSDDGQADRVAHVKNAAVKLLRQTSVETPEKTKKSSSTRRTSKESTKTARDSSRNSVVNFTSVSDSSKGLRDKQKYETADRYQRKESYYQESRKYDNGHINVPSLTSYQKSSKSGRSFKDLPSLSDYQQSTAFKNRETRAASPASETVISKTTTNTISAKDFTALSKISALTSHDKYNLLDARDKLLRKQQTIEVDVKKAQYLSATCPDMCPEKERFRREVQYDLSPYEMTHDRKVDHAKAVKKFSRSSADKDEPLPHELRTGPVLVRTMDFLMCNIMHEMEEGTGADMDLCYNYLWDRSRAMRSDIMQQHLVSKSAVYVLERCVRFHIFCSERLCLEPPDVFDPKMNAEHLTKSMQTLKELYYDMSLNEIYFDSECEFRSYELLLNVFDGDIMFAYLLFRESVRNSETVQFAVKVLHAVQSNNYARFFKLVKRATFLQACVMHKYFNRIRSKALHIMMKSLQAPGRCQTIDLHELMSLLAFDSIEEATAFLVVHGISVDDGTIAMDRTSYISHPEANYERHRALNVIDSKKHLSVSEVINGGKLPENPLNYHNVHNSFSHSGYLHEQAVFAKDQQEEASLGTDVSLSEERTVPEQQEEKQVIGESIKKDTIDLYTEEVIGESLETEKGDTYDENQEDDQYDQGYEEEYDQGYGEDYDEYNEDYGECDEQEYTEGYDQYAGKEYEESVYNDSNAVREVTVSGNMYNEYEDEYSEDAVENEDYNEIIFAFQQSRNEKYLRFWFDKWRKETKESRVAHSAILKLTKRAPLSEEGDWRTRAALKARDEAIEKLAEFKLKERYYLLWKTNAQINKRLRELKVCNLSRITLSKWRAFVVKQKHLHLISKLKKVVERNLRQISVRSIARQWRRKTYLRKVMRQLREKRRGSLQRKYYLKWRKCVRRNEWPARHAIMTLEEQSKAWRFNCGKSRISFTELRKLEEKLEEDRAKEELSRKLSEEICKAPLPVRSIFQTFIDDINVPNWEKPKFFTLCLCFDDHLDDYIIDWFRVKFNPLENAATAVPIDYSYNIKSSLNNEIYTIQIIEVRRQNMSEVKGVSSIVYIVDRTDHPILILKDVLPRIETLTMFRESCFSPKMTSSLKGTLLSLYKKSMPSSQLETSTFNQLLTSFICKNVLDVMNSTEKIGKEFESAPFGPAAYCDLYATALEHLKDVLLSRTVQGMEWHKKRTNSNILMRPEVKAVNESYTRMVKSAFLACTLGEIRENFTKSWSEALTGILSYTRRVTNVDSEYSLIPKIVWFVKRARERLIARGTITEENNCLPHMCLLPWKDIISSLITYKLGKLPHFDVIYSVKELGKFKYDNEWYTPYLAPIETIPALFPSHKRKAMLANVHKNASDVAAKKARCSLPDKRKEANTAAPQRKCEILEDIRAERKHTDALLMKVRGIMNCDVESGSNVVDNEQKDMTDTSSDSFEYDPANVLQEAISEKENYKALMDKIQGIMKEGASMYSITP